MGTRKINTYIGGVEMAQNKLLLRTYFENEIRKSNGQSFEDLFVKIMCAYDHDFTPVKAYGNIGDRKNDGFNYKTGTYFQVYAPEVLTKNNTLYNAVSKLENDFKGLLENWDSICKVKTYYFVINNKFDAIPAPLAQKIIVLRTQYPAVRIEIFDNQKLWDIFCSFDTDTIKGIFTSMPESIIFNDSVYTSENIEKNVKEIGSSIFGKSFNQDEICDDYLNILYPGILAEPESDKLITLKSVLEQAKDVQIIGPAGAGKSMLAFDMYTGLINSGNKVIPLFLKTYGYDGHFNNYLYYQIIRTYVQPDSVEANSVEKIKNVFANEREYKYIIFVDGINETSSMLEGDLLRELNELSSFESCKVVVLVRNKIESLETFEKYFVNEVPENIVYSRIHSYYNLPYETKRILRRPLLIEAYKEIFSDDDIDQRNEFTEAEILFSFYKNKINKMGQSQYSVARHEYVKYVSVVVFNYFAFFCWSISRVNQVIAEFNEDYFDHCWSEWGNNQGSSKRATVRDDLGFNYITVLNDMNLIHKTRSDLYHEYYYIDQFIVDYYCSLYIANSLLEVDADVLFDIKQNESINKYIACFCDKNNNKPLFKALEKNKGKRNDKTAGTNKKIISCLKYCKLSLELQNFSELDLSLVDFMGENWHGTTFVNSYLSRRKLFADERNPVLPIVALNADNVDHCVYMLEMGGYIYKYDLEEKEFVGKSIFEFEHVEAYGLGVPEHSCVRILSNGIFEGRKLLTVWEYSFLTKEKKEVLSFLDSRCYVMSNNGKWIVLDFEDSMMVVNINTQRVKMSMSKSMFKNTITDVTITDDGQYVFVIDMFYNGYIVDLDNDEYVECYVPLLSNTVYVNDFGFVLFDMNGGVHVFENSANIMYSRCAKIGILSNQLGLGCFPSGDISVMKTDNKLYAIWSQMLNSVVYKQEVGYDTKIGKLFEKTGVGVTYEHIALSWDSSKVAFYSMDGYVRVYSIEDKRLTNAFRNPERNSVRQLRWSKDGKYLGAQSWENIIIYNTLDGTCEVLNEDVDSFEFVETANGWGILGYKSPLSSKLDFINVTVISKEDRLDDELGTFILYLSEDRYRIVFQDKNYRFDQLMKFENGAIGAINWDCLMCTFIDFWGDSELFQIELPEEVAAIKDFIKCQAYYNQPAVISYDGRGKMEFFESNGQKQQIEGIQYGLNIMDCDFTGCTFDGADPDDALIRKIIMNGGKYVSHVI